MKMGIESKDTVYGEMSHHRSVKPQGDSSRSERDFSWRIVLLFDEGFRHRAMDDSFFLSNCALAQTVFGLLAYSATYPIWLSPVSA